VTGILPSLSSGRLPPCLLRLVSGVDGHVDIGLITSCGLGEHLAINGTDVVEVLAIGRRHEFTVDIVVILVLEGRASHKVLVGAHVHGGHGHHGLGSKSNFLGG
jgi:hypothetical protein